MEKTLIGLHLSENEWRSYQKWEMGGESDERKGNWIIYLYLELLFKIGLKLDASNAATKFEKDIKGILATSTTKVNNELKLCTNITTL